ncbi:MAG: hypothetical protein V1783_02495 [Bacteroidota bacterium]
MCKAIGRILPDIYFVKSKLKPDRADFQIVESYGFDPFLNAIKKLIGKDSYTMEFQFNKFTEAQKLAFESRKMFYFSG